MRVYDIGFGDERSASFADLTPQDIRIVLAANDMVVHVSDVTVEGATEQLKIVLALKERGEWY